MLKVNQLKKIYGKQMALNGVDLQVGAGDFIAIMGPSGSGKSTLLNILSGIDNPTSGEVYFGNMDITKLKPNQIDQIRQAKMGFVFQEYHILDSLTCFENISLPLTIRKVKIKQLTNIIENMAKRLGIQEILEKYPYQISGGEKQRVAIARAMITNPSIVFADEPTGALDSKNATTILNSLRILNDEQKLTIVMVTHDPFVASFSKKVIFLKDGNVYNTFERGNLSKKAFFEQIIQVSKVLGGDFDAL